MNPETLTHLIGPRVPGHQHLRPRYLLPTLLLVAAALLLLISIFTPYWNMTLHAPQYPKGLRVTAYLNHLTGDVNEIDGLNHYIGMRPLHEAAQFERSASIAMTCILALLIVSAVFIHTRFAAWLSLPAMLFPAGFLGDLYFWLAHFGQNLDPRAPLSHAIKPFTPPVLGVGMIGQFKTVALPDTGLILAAIASILIAVGLWFHRAAYKPLLDESIKMPTNSSDHPEAAHRCNAFSLVELLVVIAIIGTLLGLMFPALAAARERGRWVACASNARSTAMAMQLYADANSEIFPNAQMMAAEPTWLDMVQPYGGNRLAYRCPSDQSPLWEPGAATPRSTTYGMNAYLSPNHPPYFGVRVTKIARPSDLIVVTELADNVAKDHFMPMYWGNPPRVANAMMQAKQWNATSQEPITLSIRRHDDGANYVFADAHADWQTFANTWNQQPGQSPTRDLYDPQP